MMTRKVEEICEQKFCWTCLEYRELELIAKGKKTCEEIKLFPNLRDTL